MIKVGFLIDFPHYVGGINYLVNLVAAAAKAGCGEVEPYMFVGTGLDHPLLDRLKKHATVVQSPLFQRGGAQWYRYKLLFKSAGYLGPVERLMKEHQIDVLSHSDVYGRGLPFRTLNWLPDFQFTELPEMFSRFERVRRHRLYRDSIKKSDMLVVSSFDAREHLRKYDPSGVEKSRVLRFVTCPDPSVYQMTRETLGEEIEESYGVGGKYFYVPNQFWKHKNHIAVLKACRILKERGMEVTFVFSGPMQDFRHPGHMRSLHEYIERAGIGENVKLLGLIPYRHVLYFMRNSVSIINPSLFEGWSTTVEEAKSMGKNIILSDLNIHREQAPPGGTFFNPLDEEELAELLAARWRDSEGGPDHELEEAARSGLERRVAQFGAEYLRHLREVCAA